MAKIDELVKKRRALQKLIVKTQAQVVTFDDNTKLSELELINATIKDLKEKVEDLFEETSMTCTDQEFSETHDADFDTILNAIHTVSVIVTDFLKSKSKSGHHINFKLERVKLPTFSGNFCDWQEFHDLFKSAVHKNSTLSGCEKMVYLKSSLSGEAAAIVSSFPTTSASYKEAWDSVIKRYSNKREIVFSHLRKLDDLKPVQETSVGLRKVSDTINECVRSLKVMEVPVEHWDVIIVYLGLKKLDPTSKKEWLLTQDTSLPELDDFIQFVETRATALADTSPQKLKQSSEKKSTSSHYTEPDSGPTKSGFSCPKCNESHRLYQCDAFKKFSVKERNDFVLTKNLCFNCFRKGHGARTCKGTTSCKTCGERHHSLLHRNPNSSQVAASTISASAQASCSKSVKIPETQNRSSSSSEEQVVSSHCFPRDVTSNLTLLGTLLVSADSSDGNSITCRVFLDPGSETNFITEHCVDRLSLKRKRTCVNISGISGSVGEPATGFVSLTIRSKVSEYFLNIHALVLKNITKNLPRIQCQSNWPHLKGITLADPTFHKPGQVDILIGAGSAAQIMLNGLIKGPTGTPSAQNTQFGWVLSGDINVSKYASPDVRVHHSTCTTQEPCLDNLVAKFWNLEEAEVKGLEHTHEDDLCEEYFVQTHTKNQDGSYTLQLPFKSTRPPLGASKEQAINRFLRMERRFSFTPEVKEAYSKIMKDYLTSKIIEPVPEEELEEQSHYLPHHPVVKESSSTTKVRIVFDASAKTSTGYSLNDILMNGPKLQVDLIPLLIRFRSYQVCMSADITKFFLQYKLVKEDTNFLRFVYRDNVSDPIQHYRFLRVSFGLKPAPFLAIRSLHQLAKDNQFIFPIASALIPTSFLVDNLLTGASDVKKAKEIQSEFLGIMKNGNLQLRQWASNDPELLENIPQELRQGDPFLSIEEDESIKTIGIRWHPVSDSFTISITPPTITKSTTKREVLSSVAKIFDPLGWLSPVTVRPKILLQEIWKAKLGWDEPLPSILMRRWSTYCSELNELEKFKIPRCFARPSTSSSNVRRLELHGFCDGSNKAYAACAYVKAEEQDGKCEVTLVAGKTKVAPVKGETTPRMELCSAFLLSKLLKTIVESLDVTFDSINCWSDSTSVLGWIASKEKLPVFQNNRVRLILNNIPNAPWRYVSSEENPADAPSRGISATSLLSHPLWLQGPDWLKTTKFMKTVEFQTHTSTSSSSIISGLIQRHSSNRKLVRIVAYIHRVIQFALKRDELKVGALTIVELDNSLNCIVKCVQSEFFSDEIRRCQSQLVVKSKIKFLVPFLDKNGILRVGGRLVQAQIPEEQKHPILLPSSSCFTKSLVKLFHLENQHAAPNLLLCIIREKFWIIRGPDLVKKVCRECIPCFRQSVKPSTQLMGQLPPARISPSRTFSQVGMDYAGPFTTVVVPGRKPKFQKSYVCLFVCMAIKAVHLELVCDLSTPAFIAAFNRFVSRRGFPLDVYCDQGTNFVGAKREFEEFSNFIKSKAHNSKAFEFFSTKGTRFHFNPPHSPHHGGLWEAAVKSMKLHLRRVTEDRHLSMEEFSTLLCQVEACLNSRPLTPLTTDPNDYHVLTPGHFLIGGPMKAVPQHDLTHLNPNRLSRWQLVQQLQQHWWRRWSSEYLQLLQSRPKWLATLPNLEPGMLVLMKDQDAAIGPCKWRLGRIVKTFYGPDGKVRVCDVKVPSGSIFSRPITKLAALPIYN